MLYIPQCIKEKLPRISAFPKIGDQENLHVLLTWHLDSCGSLSCSYRCCDSGSVRSWWRVNNSLLYSWANCLMLLQLLHHMSGLHTVLRVLHSNGGPVKFAVTRGEWRAPLLQVAVTHTRHRWSSCWGLVFGVCRSCCSSGYIRSRHGGSVHAAAPAALAYLFKWDWASPRCVCACVCGGEITRQKGPL